jgi:putative transposase
MPNYRRFYIPNATIFITCVTRKRYPYLKSKPDIDLFFGILEKVNEIHPFELQAYVMLPDHFHWLMKVDESSGNFSKIMHSIKRNFTRNYKHSQNIQQPLTLWQRGFWDHVIRDEQDFGTHLDYIHWNPIKHGYVNKPEDWPYSSYKDWVKDGVYEQGWGWVEEPLNINGLNFE